MTTAPSPAPAAPAPEPQTAGADTPDRATNTGATSAPAPWRGRWLALAGILLAALNLRTAVTSLTPLLSQLEEVFGFGSTISGVLGMVPTAAFAAFGVATPAIARRIGLRRTVLLAMAAAATGLLARGLVGSTTALLLSSALALSGMGIGNVVLPPLVKRYFPDRVAPVSTLYITMLQLGTVLPALAAVPLAQAAGWRTALGAWSLIALAALLPWLMLLWRSPERRPLSGNALTAVADGQVWRTSLGWGMALMFGMTSSIVYAMFTWLPQLLVDAGGSPALGGTMLGVYSAMGLAGAFTMPTMAVRLRNPFLLVVGCCVLHLIAFAGLLLAPMTLTLLWVVLLGLGPVTFPLALTLINLRTRSAGGSAALSGFTQGVGYTVSCAGPLLFGLLHDRSGGWEWPFAFLVGCLLLLLVGGYLACRPRMLEDHWQR